MQRTMAYLKSALLLVKARQGSALIHQVRRNVASTALSIGLRRDLTVPHERPEANVPLTVRPIVEEDVPRLFDIDRASLDAAGVIERRARLRLITAGIGACYVAVTDDGTPCYMQWLIPASENAKIRQVFGGAFPVLQPDEALLEGAFTLEGFRGQRIMPAAMAAIAEKAADLGARWVITFVADSNVPSLKGCKRAGFVPYLVRRERRRLLRRRFTFTQLPDGAPYPFDSGG